MTPQQQDEAARRQLRAMGWDEWTIADADAATQAHIEEQQRIASGMDNTTPKEGRQ